MALALHGLTRRCPNARVGARSPRSTSSRSSPRTTRRRMVRRVRCCVARVCTPATSTTGARLATPGRWPGWAHRRGRPRRDPREERIGQLEAEKQRLEQELAKARFVVDVQSKLHALLETLSEGADTEPTSTP